MYVPNEALDSRPVIRGTYQLTEHRKVRGQYYIDRFKQSAVPYENGEKARLHVNTGEILLPRLLFLDFQVV